MKVLNLEEARYNYISEKYSESVQSDGRFVNGSLYQDFYNRSAGHQFFLTKNWSNGSVTINGKWQKQVPLRYDIYSDLLIYNHIQESGVYAVKLNKFRIDSFFIEGHSFCNLHANSGLSQDMNPGFYELISNGPATFYQKWIKRYNEPSQNSAGEFVLYNELYILNKEKFYKITRKPGLIKALNDREKEIKAFIKKQKIYIGTGDVVAIKKVVDYYNSLEQ